MRGLRNDRDRAKVSNWIASSFLCHRDCDRPTRPVWYVGREFDPLTPQRVEGHEFSACNAEPQPGQAAILQLRVDRSLLADVETNWLYAQRQKERARSLTTCDRAL